MAKRKINKTSKRRLVFFGTISVVLIIYFIFNLTYYTVNIYKLKNEEKSLTSSLKELKHDEKLLESEIGKLNDKDYLARFARENYAYSKDGVLVIKLEKNDEKIEEEQVFDIDFYDNKIIIVGAIIIILIILYVIRKGKRKKSN